MGQSGCLVGIRRGILNIVEALDKRESYNGRSYRFYRCVCDCGVEKILSSRYLTPDQKSCGCARKAAGIRSRKGSAADFSARRVWSIGYKNGCSFDVFMQLSQLPCFYCGAEPSNSFNGIGKDCSPEWRAQGTFIYNGLDRIDSSKDHKEDNIVPCCKMCNWMKNKTPQKKFLEHIKKIYTYCRMSDC